MIEIKELNRVYDMVIENNILYCLMNLHNPQLLVYDFNLQKTTLKFLNFIPKSLKFFNNSIVILDNTNSQLLFFDKRLNITNKLQLNGKNFSYMFYDKDIYFFDNYLQQIIKIDTQLNITNIKVNLSNINSLYKLDDKFFLVDEKAKLHIFYKNKITSYFSYGRDGYTKFRKPSDIQIFNDYIFINDENNYLIQIFDKNLNFIKQIGSKGDTNYSFDLPKRSYVNKFYFICDYNNDRILKMDKNFKITTFIKRKFKLSKLSRPAGLCNNQKYIFIADRSNNIIQVFDFNLNFVMVLNYFLHRPSAIVYIDDMLVIAQRDDYKKSYLTYFKVDYLSQKLIKLYKAKYDFKDIQDIISNNKFVFVADTLNRKIIKFNKKGEFISQIDMTKISNNDRILIKSITIFQNNIFTVDFDEFIIYQFDENLNFIKKIDLSIYKKEFKVIRAIYIDDNYIIISNRGKNQLVLVDFNGNIIKNIKGNFKHPTKIIKVNQYFYITDKENDRVLKFNKNWEIEG